MDIYTHILADSQFMCGGDWLRWATYSSVARTAVGWHRCRHSRHMHASRHRHPCPRFAASMEPPAPHMSSRTLLPLVVVTHLAAVLRPATSDVAVDHRNCKLARARRSGGVAVHARRFTSATRHMTGRRIMYTSKHTSYILRDSLHTTTKYSLHSFLYDTVDFFLQL